MSRSEASRPPDTASKKENVCSALAVALPKSRASSSIKPAPHPVLGQLASRLHSTSQPEPATASLLLNPHFISHSPRSEVGQSIRMDRMAARRAVAVAVALTLLAATASADSWLYEKFTTEGNVRADYNAQGQQVTSLILTQQSGGAFRSREKYLYGEFSIQMKLVRGNSAGTVTSFYLTSGDGDGHDEIDMEFMGNSTGQPVVLNTNVWANGDGKKEHQFYLWFDPAADYHTYTVIWNDKNVIFKVDDLFIRSFKRYPDLAYPGGKPMSVHATLWDGSFWATQQGKVKVDWNSAPFVVSYRGYSADACVPNGDGRPLSCPAGTDRWMNRQLDGAEWGTVAWARKNYMHYNYCEDGWRFPQGFPAECSRN